MKMILVHSVEHSSGSLKVELVGDVKTFSALAGKFLYAAVRKRALDVTVTVKPAPKKPSTR